MNTHKPAYKMLLILLLIYCTASLVHFIHNAEFLADYPGLPVSWTSEGVYFAWLGMTTVGIFGWVLLSRGYSLAGLLFLAVYAVMGMDSLGHYVLAPLSDHTAAMNSTILFEVVTGALVLAEVMRQMVQRIVFLRKTRSAHNCS